MVFLSKVPPPAEVQRGLVLPVGNSSDRLVMTDQEICDDVLATVPKLKAAASNGTFGKRWKQRKTKNEVDLFELSPLSSDDVNDDLDIVHAVAAKTELRCHLNEVLNVLINPQSCDYENTMQSLCGKKFESGKVLFKQRRKFRFQRRNSKAGRTRTRVPTSNLPQDGLVSVQTMTLRPKIPVRLSSKHKASQELAFASCTLQYPTKDRAVHVMKTLPKSSHDKVVSAGFTNNDDRSALRRGVDHIAVGIDIQSTHGSYSAQSHTTRIFLHTYASVVAPSEYTKPSTQRHHLATPEDIAHQRKALMNPEARHAMDILTKSLRQYETVIRRRRIGFQSFVAPQAAATAPKNCFVCRKKFRFYRRDAFCNLCGHAVCTDCSQTHDVEARVGEVRKNRCCIECIVRVDNCVFDDEDLLAALGPAVIEADPTTWSEDYPSLAEIFHDDSALDASMASVEDLSQSLRSRAPSKPSRALESLARLVRAPGSTLQNPNVTPRATQVLQEVDAHVRSNVQDARHEFPLDKCDVYGREHDYVYSFLGDSDTPLAPEPASEKELQRLKLLKQSGVLSPSYDHAALDMLARLAAKHLKCPFGYVSVVDAYEQRIIGAFDVPETTAMVAPRDQTLCMHGVYAEKPMVIQNPRHDQRFAQLPVVKNHGLQFYAGFPIRAPDGTVVATLCTGDKKPHANITTKEYATMKVLANLAAELLVPRALMRESHAHNNAMVGERPVFGRLKTPKTKTPRMQAWDDASMHRSEAVAPVHAFDRVKTPRTKTPKTGATWDDASMSRPEEVPEGRPVFGRSKTPRMKTPKMRATWDEIPAHRSDDMPSVYGRLKTPRMKTPKMRATWDGDDACMSRPEELP